MFYLVFSFTSPLPWSEDGYDNKCNIGPASEYFFREILQFQNEETCEFLEPGDISKINWYVYISVVVAWIIIYLCVFKGVKSSSFVVWVTVPTPIILLIILLIRGATMSGAWEGIKLYLTGEEGTDIGEILKQSQIWSDAIGQVFFSIGVCTGVMTSFGSYNPRDKPVIADSFIIALMDLMISFISGFTIFSIIGYLRYTNNPVSDQVSSFGLAYIALPTAAADMPGANFWNILLFLTLFFLGIDSAFSLVEAVSTVIHDTPIGMKINRMIIAAVVCILGCTVSIVFVTDVGYILLDVVDHYLTTYTMILLGILQ